MIPILDAQYSAAPDADAARPSGLSRLPDLHERPRFRLPSMVSTGIAFVLAATAFYGAETLLPVDYRPSHFIGGYDRAIAQARSEGELSAKIEYDKKSKVFEAAAGEWQEQCRAQLQNVNNYTQAIWQRAGIGYQLAADMQRQLMSSRLATVQSSVGGEIGAANTATSLGYIFGMFDEELGQSAMDWAEKARQQALRKIDEAAARGVIVSPQGWDTGLTDPSKFAASLKCEMPRTLLPDQPATGR